MPIIKNGVFCLHFWIEKLALNKISIVIKFPQTITIILYPLASDLIIEMREKPDRYD